MQLTNIKEIKMALWDQAFVGRTRVSCPMGQVVAKRREERTTPGNDSWMGSLVPCEGRDH